MKLQIDPSAIRLRHPQHYIAVAEETQHLYIAGGERIVSGWPCLTKSKPTAMQQRGVSSKCIPTICLKLGCVIW